MFIILKLGFVPIRLLSRGDTFEVVKTYFICEYGFFVKMTRIVIMVYMDKIKVKWIGQNYRIP
jgi:hypothetical protein